MKQTLEEAAKEELIHCYSNKYNGNGAFEYGQEAMLNMFYKGAEWHSRQLPWINVEDKAGCDTSNDCIVMVLNGDIFRAYFSSENKWMKRNCGYYDEVIDDVVRWMPIPSFDEILEANRDVLERIKEKGD